MMPYSSSLLLLCFGLIIYAKIPVLKITDEHASLPCKASIAEGDCKKPLILDPAIKKTLKNFEFVDSHGEDANAVTSVRGKGYVGRENEGVNITVKAVGISPDIRYDILNMCFHTRNAEKLFFTYESSYNPGDFEGKEYDIDDDGKKSKWTRTCIFPKVNVTKVVVEFVLDNSRPQKQINIKGLSIKGCKEPEFDITTEPIWNKTRDFCINHFIFRSPWARRLPNDYELFLINNKTDGPEWDTLSGSPDPFKGPKGKDVIMEFKTTDGKDFEWWHLCIETKNADRLEFTLDAKFVIYKEKKEICDKNPSLWTHFCYAPWGRDVIVRKGQVKVVLLRKKGAASRVEIRMVRFEICRDHHYYKNFALHTNPGDYKVMTINTIRNQTITIYGLKNADGGLKQTELYHYTDHTGNHGDNTRFIIGSNNLVQRIWTDLDTINFKWKLSPKNNQLLMSVISFNGKFQTSMHIDLDKLQVIKTSKQVDKNSQKGVKISDRAKHLKRLKVPVTQCNNRKVSDLFLYGSVGGSEIGSKVTEMGRFSGDPGVYEFIMPAKLKVTVDGKAKQRLCKAFVQAKKRECSGHDLLDRSRYRFICQQLRVILAKFTAVASDVTLRHRSRIHEACDMAFRTTNIICRVIRDSPRPGRPTYFDRACDADKNITFKNKFPSKVPKFELQPIVRDSFGRKTTARKSLAITIPFKDMTLPAINNNEFQIETTTEPEIPTKEGYMLNVFYNCISKEATTTRIEITLVTPNPRDHIVDCVDLGKRKCSCCRFNVTKEMNDIKANVRNGEFGTSNHFTILYLVNGRRTFQQNFYTVL